jgi:DNA-damage-inducible protein J
MAKSAMIRARIEPELKEQVESIFEKLGLSASEAISVFYRQVKLQKGLPFDVKIPNRATRKAMKDAELGRNLKTYKNTEEMFRNLAIKK